MLDRRTVIERIKERIQTQEEGELCALFLIFVKTEGENNSEGTGGEADCSQWIQSVLSRFFRQTDIVGNFGGGYFTVFLTGSITGNAVYEKAAGLVQAIRIAAGDYLEREPEVRVGVYLAAGEEKDYAALFRKAEYAMEMARKDKKRHFYMYTSPDIQGKSLELLPSPIPTQMMYRYIDEGVRIMEGGDMPKTTYISPGFFRRLSLDEGTAKTASIQIHPDDTEDYEEHLQEVFQTGKPVDSYYRISKDGKDWIPCRVRLLRISGGDGEHPPVVIEISHNIAGLERLKGQLDEKTAWLSFVADQTDYRLWEVDLQTRVFRMLYTGDLMGGRRTVYENFPESLIECGRIHNRSAEAFRSFAREMMTGQMQGSGNFMVQYRQTSCYGWVALSYRTLSDENGQPVKAIGIKEEMSYIPRQQSRFVQRRIMPADLYSELYCYLQADLTTDSVEKLLLEGRERVRLIQYQTYEAVIEKGIIRLFSEEDAKRIRTKFSRARLLTEFAEGWCWSWDKCRIVDFDGSIRWISIGANVSRDSETGDICLYAYLSRADRLLEWEKGLREAVQAEPETGLYGCDDWEKLVKNLLKKNAERLCTVVQISIEGAADILTDGAASRKMRDIAAAFHVFLNTDCLAGWKDDSNLLVFFPEEGDRVRIRRRLENVFFFVRVSLSGMAEMESLRFAAGAVCRSNSESLEQLLDMVSGMCALHAGEAADSVEFCYGGETEQWESAALKEHGEPGEARPLETAHELTGKEKDMVLECMGMMLSAGSARDSLNGVLRRIGEYYRADRVYILILTEDKQIMTMLNEWVRPGKCGIQQSISGKRTVDFPVIANYAKHPEKVLLTRKEGEQNIWQYVIFPMDGGKDAEQMLCIENPQKDLEHTAFIDKLLPFLGRERERFQDVQMKRSPLERFAALPNMDDCMNVLYTIEPAEYSSLGIMMVDVPEYEKLKNLRGFEYGRQLLVHISEVLQTVFDKSLLFHTKETEFLVLCTNVVYNTFLDLSARAKQMIGRRNRGLFRMGCTWSDGIFSARDLMKKARSIMECDKPEAYVRPSDNQNRLLEQDVLSRLQAKGSMTIYLQPKIDMRDGRLMGAEALVRILDTEGNLLPHGRVIDAMEKDGTIQKLDYFVLDRLLAAMDQWRKKGYSMYPMSSNFSRNTLLNPAALASVLAVLSRYPLVPQDLVELEITETAGDYENNTFEEVIRQFGEYGLQFSLDDFGSGYSNVNMLAGLKFHSVKLDRSLINNVTENQTARMLVRNLVHICESCGITCIAEGVENQSQAATLLEDGCVCGQGYYYDRPLSLERFEEKYLQPVKKEGLGC